MSYTYVVTETRTHHIHLDTPDPAQARLQADQDSELPESVFDVEWDVEAPLLIAALRSALDDIGVGTRLPSWRLAGIPWVVTVVGNHLIEFANSRFGLRSPMDGPSALEVRIFRNTSEFEEVDGYAAPIGVGYDHALSSIRAITHLVNRYHQA